MIGFYADDSIGTGDNKFEEESKVTERVLEFETRTYDSFCSQKYVDRILVTNM